MPLYYSLFFFNDTATTEIYTLSLHDALPIFSAAITAEGQPAIGICAADAACFSASPLVHNDVEGGKTRDRKSTRLNSSHANNSYAVFCLKKKKRERWP